MNTRNRILRNEQDASPGGGALPEQPAIPAASAGVAEQANPVSLDEVRSTVGQMLGEFRNGFFADARKAGLLKQDKQTETTQHAATSTATPGSPASGVSLDDVKRLLSVKDAAAMLRYERGATPTQLRHFEQMCEFVKPDDPAGYAKSWADDLGISKAATATATQQAQAPAIPTGPAQPPISDKGSPAPGGVLDWEREFSENPIGMSPAARQRMDAKHGVEKARRMRLEAAQRQAETIRVTKPQG